MSFSRKKRETIKAYILEKIGEGSQETAKKTIKAFSITENTFYRYMRQLQDEGLIRKKNGRGGYVLADDVHEFRYDTGEARALGEDGIYRKDIFPLLEDLPENVIHLWDYCFTEMMNNAIEHADASAITVTVTRNHIFTTILLADDGIGAFRKIKDFWHFAALEDAVMELFKGKLTTDSENHSGEGIFFTSRICDVFAVISDGKCFSHSNFEEILQDISEVPGAESRKDKKGTMVLMRISNRSQKKAADIFNRFADVDGGFTRTSIPLRHLFDRYPVSRSQAKRLVKRFEEFEEVELDFEGIEDMGQGFAHQIFNVFQRQCPQVKITTVNENETVRRMIHHALH